MLDSGGILRDSLVRPLELRLKFHKALWLRPLWSSVLGNELSCLYGLFRERRPGKVNREKHKSKLRVSQLDVELPTDFAESPLSVAPLEHHSLSHFLSSWTLYFLQRPF